MGKPNDRSLGSSARRTRSARLARSARIPKSLVINGERWTVIRANLTRRGLLGLCVHTKLEIRLDTGLRGQELAETFLHEVLHACLPERFNVKTEEKMVLRIAPRLLGALKDIGWMR